MLDKKNTMWYYGICDKIYKLVKVVHQPFCFYSNTTIMMDIVGNDFGYVL